MSIYGRKQDHKKYRTYDTESAFVKKLKEENINTDLGGSFERRGGPDDGCFYSGNITIQGAKVGFVDDSSVKRMIREIKNNPKYNGTFEPGSLIPGLYCPNCGYPAIATDHPHVASCTNVIGWYFFYERLDEEVKDKEEYEMKIINGQLMRVKKMKVEGNIKNA